MKYVTLGMVLLATAAAAFGQVRSAPEIDPAFGGTALALLSGAVVMIRARRK